MRIAFVMDDLSVHSNGTSVTAARYALDWASRCRLIQRFLSQCLQVGGNKAAWAAAPTQSPRMAHRPSRLPPCYRRRCRRGPFRSCEKGTVMATISNPFVMEVPRKLTDEELVNAIRQDIIGELEAIHEYDAHVQATDNEDAKKVLSDIRDEEREHMGELLELLERLAPDEKALHDEGRGEVREMLRKIIRKEAGDGSGLIYGMGHAVYTKSDPRAVILKKFAKKLADQKGMLEEFELFEAVERLTPEVFADVKGDKKVMSANVDMYSGLVYKMMDIPTALYTPLFAVARMVGWCAHRIEEVYNSAGRIMRPAYKAVAPSQPFIQLNQRG